MTKGFNTGRKYTANGQRIAYKLVDAGTRVLFADYDRMIYGEFKWYGGDVKPGDVMRAYDSGEYDMSCDAMMRGTFDEVEFPLYRA